jgi:hypothetical protein
MADKDESTSDAVTIDTNPGNLVAHPPLRGHTTIYSTIDLEKQNLVTLLLMFDCHDTHVLYQCMYMTKIHDSHTCIQLNPENDHAVTFVARKLKCTLKPGIIYMWRFLT